MKKELIPVMTEQGEDYGNAIKKWSTAYAMQCGDFLPDDPEKYEMLWNDYLLVHATQIALGIIFLQRPTKDIDSDLDKISGAIRHQFMAAKDMVEADIRPSKKKKRNK